MTLKKKAADERLVVPKTHTTKFTHASRKTKKNGRHLYAHEPHILLRIFLFIVKNKKKKILLVFSLHFSRSFESYDCAIYSFFFLIRVHPQQRSAPRSFGDA